MYGITPLTQQSAKGMKNMGNIIFIQKHRILLVIIIIIWFVECIIKTCFDRVIKEIHK